MLNDIYHLLKPVIPRRIQILLRSEIALRKRTAFSCLWPIDEKAAHPPSGWPGWPDGKRFALVLTHDVDTAKGQKNCYPLMQLEMRMGLRSSFNFVPEDYLADHELHRLLTMNGFEVGVHGLNHKGNPFRSKIGFLEQASKINEYMKEWDACGFRAPCMYHNLEWVHHLDILYDASTFDTDPFEPQSDGVGTIFPFLVREGSSNRRYVELPYTLPQDSTLFLLLKEKNIAIWETKLDWLVNKGGMVLVNTHPDYMEFGTNGKRDLEYPVKFYLELLDLMKTKYTGQYWHVLPKEMAQFCLDRFVEGDLV